nr:unnamed protein product [Callosobruchus chinensis]
MLIDLYHAYIASRLNYAVVFWGFSPAADSVFIAQKRIVRCILGLSPTTSCRGKFRQLKLLTLTGISIFEIGKYIFSNKGEFTVNKDHHDYNTRSKYNFRVPYDRLQITCSAPHSLGLKIYNQLPEAIKNLKTLSTFKQKLRCFLVEKELYSLEEYWV